MYKAFITHSSLYKLLFNSITNKFNYYFSCFNKSTCIYVLYKKNTIIDTTFTIDIDSDWDHDEIPCNWSYGGTKQTFQPETSKYDDVTYILNTQYSEYDMFIGPKTETEMMFNYLSNFFSKLQKEKKIFYYVIQNNSIPPDIDSIFVVPIFEIETMQR
uniref:Uncharacterized protein n=1 Tax=viral metagenome TaxID=1070528 RepID=A0A6C0ISN1_9ZZZZ